MDAEAAAFSTGADETLMLGLPATRAPVVAAPSPSPAARQRPARPTVAELARRVAALMATVAGNGSVVAAP